MKKIIYTSTLLMLMLTSCRQKIGFVDRGVVVNGYQKKKDLETAFRAKSDAFKKKTDSISKLFQAEVIKKQAIAKASTRQKAQRLMMELQKKQQQLQQQLQREQQQLQQSFQTQMDSVIDDVKHFVKTYGQQHGYTYILGTSDVTATVMYSTKDQDLTNAILNALNAASKKEQLTK